MIIPLVRYVSIVQVMALWKSISEMGGISGKNHYCERGQVQTGRAHSQGVSSAKCRVRQSDAEVRQTQGRGRHTEAYRGLSGKVTLELDLTDFF